MSDAILQTLVSSQFEQTTRLRELSESMIRVECALECLPELKSQVATLTQESRDQKLALKWLKGAGGVVLAILGYLVTFLKP